MDFNFPCKACCKKLTGGKNNVLCEVNTYEEFRCFVTPKTSPTRALRYMKGKEPMEVNLFYFCIFISIISTRYICNMILYIFIHMQKQDKTNASKISYSMPSWTELQYCH